MDVHVFGSREKRTAGRPESAVECRFFYFSKKFQKRPLSRTITVRAGMVLPERDRASVARPGMSQGTTLANCWSLLFFSIVTSTLMTIFGSVAKSAKSGCEIWTSINCQMFSGCPDFTLG